jgi:tetratricopeptide (TPR) repeat protein
LSYASGDAAAAERICTSLRAAGIEVWFDRSELRGGDAWDQSIRKQIKSCALFFLRAIKLTREALASEPLRAGWYEWLAIDLLGLNRLDESEAAVRKALEIQPHAEGFYQALTMIAIQRGDPRAALAAAQQEPPGGLTGHRADDGTPDRW